MSELRSKLSDDIRSIGQANAVMESVLAHIRVRPVIACRVFGMPSAPAVLKRDISGFAWQLLLGRGLTSGCFGGGLGGKCFRICAFQPVAPAPVMFYNFVMRFCHEGLAFGLWLPSAVVLSFGDRAAIQHARA